MIFLLQTTYHNSCKHTHTPPLCVYKTPLFLVFYKNKNLACNIDQIGGDTTRSGEGHAGGNTAGTTGIFYCRHNNFFVVTTFTHKLQTLTVQLSFLVSTFT
jgi:hypothetical protein